MQGSGYRTHEWLPDLFMPITKPFHLKTVQLPNNISIYLLIYVGRKMSDSICRQVKDKDEHQE